MAKRIFLFFYLGVLGLVLGAQLPAIAAVRPLVSQVDVYCRLDGETTHMHLTQDREMESILSCLRACQSHIPAPQQPPAAKGDSCLIRVLMTDGTSHLYRQLSEEYFAADSGLWKQIDPRQGIRIFVLLRTLKTQGFQGAFPVYPTEWHLMQIHSKFFDKSVNNIPLYFVRYGVFYLIVYSAIAFSPESTYNTILINWY